MVSNVIQNDNHINICLASDNNFVQHLAVTIASILDNAKTSKVVDIYILNDGSISEKNKNKIQKLTKLKAESSINFIDIDGSIFSNMFIRRKSHFTLATYYRFLLQDLFPQLSKIIYLDCDLVVLTDIENLYNVDLEGNYIAAVKDIIGISNKYRLGLNHDYCNAGVMIFDLNKFRENDIQKQLFDCAETMGNKLLWQDQDVLNIVLNGKIKILDLSWNLQCVYDGDVTDFTEKELTEAKENLKILHYIGKKPWTPLTDKYRGDLYFKYLELTDYKNFKTIFNIKTFIYKLFHVCNLGQYKKVYIFGFCLRFRRKLKVLETKIQKLENELSYLKHIVKDELKNTMGEKCKIR